MSEVDDWREKVADIVPPEEWRVFGHGAHTEGVVSWEVRGVRRGQPMHGATVTVLSPAGSIVVNVRGDIATTLRRVHSTLQHLEKA